MSPERQRLIRLMFDEYIEMYAARDERLVTRFSDNFSGFAGSSDQLIKRRGEWIDVTLQDFAQVPGRIGIDVVDFLPQELSDDVVAVTAFFHIHLPIPDTVFARETARLVLVFRQEGGDWKIVHSSISIPFGVVRDSHLHPVDRLQELNRELLARNGELQALVHERTQALALANEQLHLVRHTDGLTGMANRSHFDQALAHEWAGAQRALAPLALIMLDVDAFKHFNDHYGHLAGDKCLQALTLTLAQMGGQSDGTVVARWGGDQWVLLLPAADAQAAVDVAQKIVLAVHALSLPHEGAPWGQVTVSLGVASMVPERDQAAEALLRRADRAMVQAKQSGRNRIERAPD